MTYKSKMFLNNDHFPIWWPTSFFINIQFTIKISDKIRTILLLVVRYLKQSKLFTEPILSKIFTVQFVSQCDFSGYYRYKGIAHDILPSKAL